MTVRQIAADYAGCGEVLRRYGETDRAGIKLGHLEPLERFAQRRGIECKTLLRELAAAAEVETAPDSSLERNVHRSFIVLALADALSIGAGWGAWLLWQIGRAENFSAAAAGSIVAHGEAQLWGFIVPFIIGIALRYLPVATSRRPAGRRLGRAIFCFLLFGIAGGFAWSLSPGRMPWLGPSSGAGLIVAAGTYLLIISSFVATKLRLTWSRFVLCSASCLCIWAVYAFWLRARFSVLGPGVFAESARLRMLELAVFGFALNAIYGFGLRLLPGFVGLGSPKSGPIESAFWLHNSGVVALIVGGRFPWANTLGTAAIAVAAIVYVLGMRGFRSSRLQRLAKGETSLRPEIGERFLRRYVQLAFVWLLVSLTMLAIGGVHSAWHAKADSHQFIGAARHGLTVGFMSLLIMGVAQRALPVLGQTLLAWPRLVRPIFALVAAGCLLRVVTEVASESWPIAYRVMPYSALCELTAFALFSANCLRTLWPPRDSLFRKGVVTERSSLKTLLAEHPAIEDEFVRWGFTYIARVRAVPSELTIGSFARGEGRNPAHTVERVNAWLHREHICHA